MALHTMRHRIVGPLPKALGKVKFLIVTVDYFTKWVEAKPLASITGKHVERQLRLPFVSCILDAYLSIVLHHQCELDAYLSIVLQHQEDTSRNNQNQQHPFKRNNVARAYTTGPSEKKPYGGSKPLCPKCNYHHDGPCAPKIDCPKLKNGNQVNRVGNGTAVARAYAVGTAETNPNSNVVTGTFLLNNRYALILFDTSADKSFVSTTFSSLIDIIPNTLDHGYDVELADGRIIWVNTLIRSCTLNFLNHSFNVDLMPVEMGSFDVIIGMDWLSQYHAFLMALLPKWRAKVTTIEESKDLTSLSLDELIGNLKVHEMIIKKDSEIVKAKVKRKSLALKAKKESSDEECSTSGSEDEGLSLRRCGDPNHLIGECPKPPKDKNQRAFVGGSWSDSGDEDDEKVKDKTCLVAHASSEICLGVDLEPNEWIKDSRCSKHMTGNRKLFSTYKAYNGDNVEHVDNLGFNLLSIGQICDNKCKVTFSEHDSEITRNGKVIGYSQNSKAYIILNKHTRKIKESLNVPFDETPPPSKTSPLVDDDLDKEEAIKEIEKKNLENAVKDETL
ncbi:retrovirus-related pol polyprotein from transposon TNT 1-94 [Tanacetum coccineum]